MEMFWCVSLLEANMCLCFVSQQYITPYNSRWRFYWWGRGRRKLASDHRRRFKHSNGLRVRSKALKLWYEAPVSLWPIRTLLDLAVGLEKKKKKESGTFSTESVSHLKYELACRLPTILWEIIFSCKKAYGKGQRDKGEKEKEREWEQSCLRLFRYLLIFLK